MSFRLRVLLLVALVAIAAVGATAWVTLEQASRQISRSAETEREAVDTVATALAEYGRDHGTWEGVAGVVEQLGYRTGQRIRVATQYGDVLVDTDTLAGRVARPVGSPPIPVNPRPRVELPADVTDPGELAALTVQAIGAYRSSVLFAACLTRNGYQVTAVEGRFGVPRPVPGAAVGGAGAPPVGDCYTSGGGSHEDDVAVQSCLGGYQLAGALPSAGPASPGPTGGDAPADRPELEFCLADAFARRADAFAPVPLHVFLGAVDEDAGSLSPVPVLVAAAVVAVLAVAGSVLLSRRVLRPIRALTAASRRLGAGDLSERVPVAGRDELAGLARSFNRMADSLQRGEERQRRLVADVAHELRTPLANVRGYLEALRDGVVAPEPELFASLYEEAVLQQRVVDDLQELALAEAGALVYHWSRVELGEVLEICRASHQAVADAAGVDLSARSDAAVTVHGDQDRLRQVLGNLLSNAVRATPAGGRVELCARRQGRWAVVTVTDTGAGIASEHLPYVFDRFWRADAARGRRTGGNGLGLAIARQIVTDHGGSIDLASQVGVGTTVTVRLPVAQPAAAPTGSPEPGDGTVQ